MVTSTKKKTRRHEYKLTETDKRSTGTALAPIAVFKSFSVLAGNDAKGYTFSITSNGKKVVEIKMTDALHSMETEKIMRQIGDDLPYAVAFLKAASHISANSPGAFNIVCHLAEEGNARQDGLAIELMNHITKWRGKTQLVHWLGKKKLELMHLKAVNENEFELHSEESPKTFTEKEQTDLD